MLCYFMLSYHVSLSHLNTSRFPIWKTCNNHTRSKFPNFFGWLRLARVNKSNTFWKIPQHRGENVKSLWKYPGRIKNSTNLIRNEKNASAINQSNSRILIYGIGLLWSWSYDSWIYNHMCKQCRSPLMLWVRILVITRCTRHNIMW